MSKEFYISYKPLRHTMVDKNSNITQLCYDLSLSTSIRTKLINDSGNVSLAVIARICRHLNVPIEEVVEVELD